MNRGKQASIVYDIKYWLADCICILLSLSLAYLCWKRSNAFIFDNELYRSIGAALIFLQIVVSLINRSYSDLLSRGYWKEFLSVCKHNFLLYSLLMIFIFITQKGILVSRMTLLLFAIINLILMYLERICVKQIAKKYYKHYKTNRSVLIVTTMPLAYGATQMFESKYDITVCGIADFSNISELGCSVNNIPVVANSKTVLDYIKLNWVDEVFVLLPKKFLLDEEFFPTCHNMGVTVHVALHKMENFNFPKRSVHTIGGTLVVTGEYANPSPIQMFFKRILDIFGSLVGLVFTGLFTLFLAPFIYFQSPGPIFFSQQRVGQNGKIFKLYKFRSMYADAEKRKAELMEQNKMNGLMFKMDNDPRITPVGKFIRKFSLDEFPQFLNVLLGHMSLVGTRPPTVDEYEQYDYHHKARLAMKPGITGMWQVSGRSDITDFEEIVRLDTEYIENWNFGLDIKILFKTFFAVFLAKGSE